jgi:conjugative relaxase-like TrwC/TraI family protein
VLRLWKVRTGDHAYYLEVTPGPGTGVEPPGAWLGRGAAGFGLSGAVSGERLAALLAGRDPAHGEPLSPSHGRVRVTAFDLTFCAPKSVSLLYGLGAADVAEQVEGAHRAAVEGALGYVERRGAAVRRQVEGNRIPVPVEGLTAAAFRHGTSRALDPHLHTHVVVANLGRAHRGPWTALDGRGLYAHRAAADALYHAQLRHELTARLGVAWGPLDRGRADVDGIDPPTRRAFSRRAVAIAGRVRGDPEGGPADTAFAGAATRPPKDVTIGPDELRPEWRRRARDLGLGARALESVLGRSPAESQRTPDPVLAPASVGGLARLVGGDGLHGHSPGVTRRQVVRAWCLSLPGGAPVAEVEAAADRLVSGLDPVLGSGRRVDGPGVSEARLNLDAVGVRRGPERDDNLRLEDLLAARGLRRGHALGRGRDYDSGRGLG